MTETLAPLSPQPERDGEAGRHAPVSLSQVLSALSRALDLTEGQPPGHTLRSCAIGMRLAEEAGLDSARRSDLYYALLLKDAGCSSNAVRFASLFGTDDQSAKYSMKLTDWHRGFRLAVRTAATVGRGGSIWNRVSRFLHLARTPDVTRSLIEIRCDRGASIARQLGFPEATAEAIRNLDEHWCGLGYPDGRCEDEIPFLARIANLAQCAEIFHARGGAASALRVARRRRGTWFDPRLVDILLSLEADREWWESLSSPEILARVVEAEPKDRRYEVDDDGLDAVASAFAEIVDAKSPFTYRHSDNVARYACAIGEELGMSPDALRTLRRAGLLHDIGKLGISSRILDKQGPLTADERTEMEAHPLFTWEILSEVEAFRGFARTAALHHEKLDGTGYPWKVWGNELDPSARILCVADIFEALTADRPYRAGMEPAVAVDIIGKDRGPKLCATAVGALESAIARGSIVPSRSAIPPN